MAAINGDCVAWRAPGRVNLIGEHTDYNGGFALPLAIGVGCTATVRATGDGTLRVRSAQRRNSLAVPVRELSPGAVRGWAAYPAGVVWALGSPGGLDIRLDSDVPAGAGLSSSAALICAVAAAVNDLLGLGRSGADLVEITHRVENDFVGAPTGGMDQMASLLAERDHVLLCDMRDRHTEQVPFDLDAAGLALLVVDSHAPHRHADGEYAGRRAACERAASLLGLSSLREATLDDLPRLDDDVLRRRVRHVITENERVLQVVALLREGGVADIGPLLTASHASMRDDYEITVPEVDTAVDALLHAGALGARMTGGGFGGCVIALLDNGLLPSAEEAVRAAYAAAGFAEPGFFTVRASDGAHRIGN